MLCLLSHCQLRFCKYDLKRFSYFKEAWLGLIVQTYSPTTQEVQEGGSQVQVLLGQQSKLKVRPGN